jgi:transcriptional regulator with XRE-family HTH domain
MPTDIVTTREIGALIRGRRKELGLSQEQLAEMVGVSYQQIQRYENGGSMLNVENIQRVARALEFPVVVFFEADRSTTGLAISTPTLTNEEQKLLRGFREIATQSDRTLAMSIIRRLIKK